MVIIQWMIYINVLKVLNKMKELTIQEKAKRYDEAIDLVNSKWHYKNQPCFIQASEIFPELKESEDENIRQWFIKYFQGYKSNGIEKFDNVLKVDDILAWLEKQINYEDIHLLKLKAKAYDDSKERMSYAYNQNKVPIGFISEIFPNLDLYENQDEQKPDNIDSKAKTHITQYCYILSLGLGKVFEHFITEDEVDLTTEELLKKHGLNEDECSVMYSNNKLNLENLED